MRSIIFVANQIAHTIWGYILPPTNDRGLTISFANDMTGELVELPMARMVGPRTYKGAAVIGEFLASAGIFSQDSNVECEMVWALCEHFGPMPLGYDVPAAIKFIISTDPDGNVVMLEMETEES